MKFYNNVSKSQLSIARFYGRMKINSVEHRYDYANDTLVPDNKIKEYEKQMSQNTDSKKPQWHPYGDFDGI